jgi:hypothetical protein
MRTKTGPPRSLIGCEEITPSTMAITTLDATIGALGSNDDDRNTDAGRGGA